MRTAAGQSTPSTPSWRCDPFRGDEDALERSKDRERLFKLRLLAGEIRTMGGRWIEITNA
jgi:hypothetical protein